VAPSKRVTDRETREFVTVARVGDIAPGKGRQVTVGDRWVGLFNVDGAYHAVDNICLHRGGPLADGVVSGRVVTCPWHHWQYDLASGTLLQDPRVGVTRHETRVVGDEVQVRLSD
jgi:nitrite reductase/ring-hydroxylating ferredoxin subunit